MSYPWLNSRPRIPQASDVLLVGREASVQFVPPIRFRVSRVEPGPTYIGWVWLDGYQINSVGDAVKQRSIFVQLAGLRWVRDPSGQSRNARTAATLGKARNAAPRPVATDRARR